MSFGDSPILLRVFEDWLFLLLGGIPLCEYTNIFIGLSILFPRGIRVLYSFEAFEYSCYEHSLSSIFCLLVCFLYVWH